MKKYLSIMIAGMALSMTSSAFAADKLTFYCSAQEDWCQLMTKEFSAATGIKVNMTRKSSGETFAQIKADQQIQKVMSGGVELVIHIFKLLKRV